MEGLCQSMKIIWANSLRGIAVISVLFAHFVVAFFYNQGAASGLARMKPIEFSEHELPKFIQFIAAIPINFGSFGVALFFLLSGYVIAISLHRYTRKGFAINRLFRIIPTYAFGYFLTCLLVYALSDPFKELIYPDVFFGLVPGMAQMFGKSVPGMGIEWTIMVECIFYLICILLFSRLSSLNTIILLALSLLGVGLCLARVDLDPKYSGWAILILTACPFLPIILIGVVIKNFKGVSRILSILLLSVVNIILIKFSNIFVVDNKYILSIYYAILFFIIVKKLLSNYGDGKGLRFLANISYPLYIIHPVLGYCLLSFLVQRGFLPAGALILTTIVIFVLAWLVHIAIENPSHSLGRKLALQSRYIN